MSSSTAPIARKLIGFALLAIAVPGIASGAGLDQDMRAPAPNLAYVPGEVIVSFDGAADAADRLDARRDAGVTLDRALGAADVQVVETDGSVTAAVERLERQPDVAYAQPNYRYRAAADPPNDTFFSSLWGLSDPALPNPGVNALAVWGPDPDATRGAGQVIAVLDTGVALDHPDLVGNLWANPDETPGGGDDDGNGHGDDVDGYDFIDDDTDPDDYNFHGTHVAGTIAATAGNALGVAGVAPAAEIMPVRVLDGDGSGSSATVAEGIQYAAREGADVLNLSLSGPGGAGDELMSDAVDEANALDALVVVAAGNESSDNDAVAATPCTLPQPNLVCVASINQSANLSGFSNYGRTSVDLAAPGSGILSTETDYDQILAEGFNVDGIPGWSKVTPNPGSIPWGSSTVSSEGARSAADSPGAGVDYAPGSDTQLVRTADLDLSAQRGCRMTFDVRYEIEDNVDEDGLLYDALFAGALAQNGDVFTGAEIAGSSGGVFEETDVSISDLDGESDVQPVFALFSDPDLFEFDGAYVDDLRILCRASTYSNAPPPTGNYVTFSGTSMATPHVAGVAALVRAADPSAPDTEVAQALKVGSAPLDALKCKTVAGGSADAVGAIAAALALPATQPGLPNGCPLPSSPPPAGGSGPSKAATVLPPAKPSLAGSPRAVRASRKGTFRYAFRATPGLTGEIRIRTRRKVQLSRRGHLTVAVKRFAVPASGKVRLRLKLSKRKLRVLRDNGGLSLTVRVTVVNTAGLSATAAKRLKLKPPKR